MEKNCKNAATELERNWPEDYPHENGCYQNKCSMCGNLFLGMKRRPICKLCFATASADYTKMDTHASAEKVERFEKVEISEGMQELKIYQYQAKRIEDAFRLVANNLKSHTKESCLDRDVMWCWQTIKNILEGKIDERVERF